MWPTPRAHAAKTEVHVKLRMEWLQLLRSQQLRVPRRRADVPHSSLRRSLRLARGSFLSRGKPSQDRRLSAPAPLLDTSISLNARSTSDREFCARTYLQSFGRSAALRCTSKPRPPAPPTASGGRLPGRLRAPTDATQLSMHAVVSGVRMSATHFKSMA